MELPVEIRFLMNECAVKKVLYTKEGTRVPCFIHWLEGGLNKGIDIDRFTWHFDLLPTLIDLCNLKTPERSLLKFDSRRLKTLLNKKNAHWNDRVVFMHEQNTWEISVKDLNR